MRTISYRLGRAWGSIGVIGKAVVFFAVVGATILWLVSAAESADAKRLHHEQVAAAAEAASAARLAAIQERQQALVNGKCIANIGALTLEASATRKSGDLDGAIKLMEQCDGVMVDGKALALLEAARNDRKALEEKTLKAQLAAEKAQKRREGVRIGMSTQDVLDSSWGRPNSVNSTTNAMGTHQQWVYDGGFLYFDNGVLTTIQN